MPSIHRVIRTDEQIPRSRVLSRAARSDELYKYALEAHFSKVINALDLDAVMSTFSVLFGAGSVGSFCAPVLSRLGVDVLIVDRDVVNVHNPANQAYSVLSATTSKASALRQSLLDHAIGTIQAHEASLTRDLAAAILARTASDRAKGNAVIVTSFDNMKARKDAFEGLLSAHGEHYAVGESPLLSVLYVDFRVDLTSFTCYVVPIPDLPNASDDPVVLDYVSTLHDDLQDNAAANGFQFQGCERQLSLRVPLACASYLASVMRSLFFKPENAKLPELRYLFQMNLDTYEHLSVPFSAFGDCPYGSFTFGGNNANGND